MTKPSQQLCIRKGSKALFLRIGVCAAASVHVPAVAVAMKRAAGALDVQQEVIRQRTLLAAAGVLQPQLVGKLPQLLACMQSVLTVHCLASMLLALLLGQNCVNAAVLVYNTLMSYVALSLVACCSLQRPAGNPV